ncbi:MAG: MFS transporter, partial [Solirubrobacterales bacterium]
VPLVRLGLLKIRTVSGANIVIMTAMAGLFAMFFFVSLYMQQVLGYTPFEAGISFLPLAVGFIVASGIASQLVGRIGFRPVIVVGLIVIAIGLYLFSNMSVDGTFLADILPASLVSALGGGFALVALIIAATSGVPRRESGLASGLVNTSQQVGGALGLAILASVAASTSGDAAAEATDPSDIPQALVSGFQDAFLVGAGIAVLGAVVALFLIHSADSRLHRSACEEDYQAQLAEDRGLAHSRVPAFGGLFCRLSFLRLVERPEAGPTGSADDAPAPGSPT